MKKRRRPSRVSVKAGDGAQVIGRRKMRAELTGTSGAFYHADLSRGIVQQGNSRLWQSVRAPGL